MATTGRETIGASEANIATSSSAGYMYRKFVFTGSVDINDVYLAVRKTVSGTTCAVAGRILNDIGGTPSSVVATTGYRVPANTSLTFESFSFSPQTLSAGTYWIGAVGSDNNYSGIRIAYDAGGEIDGNYAIDLSLSSSPALRDWDGSIYVDYTEIAATSNPTIMHHIQISGGIM